MDSSLIANFIRFPTAKQVWDSAATTYFDGTDTSQVYDLRRRVTRMKQAGGSIEKYYNDLQGLWREIDFRRPNPMECAGDIQKYNSILQEDRVYIFLDGLDDRLDKTRSDVLQLKPFPTVEQAYAHVRREDVRQMVMTSGAATAPGVVMASKGIKADHYHTPPKTGILSLSNGKSNPSSKSKAPSDGMKCTHCGNAKHTRETCFKVHGYPDWWHDLQARKKREAPIIDDSTGRAAMVTGEPSLSLTSQVESSHHPGNGSHALHISPQTDDDKWILDSGATDHMTFDSNDLSHTTPPRRSHVANANGVTYPVTGAETDILTKEIIGRESDTFFPSPASNSTLQGEFRDEEQNWLGCEGLDVELGCEGLDVENNPTHMNDGNDMIEPDVQTVLGVDMYPRAEPVSSANAESEDEFPHSSVPDPDDPPSENIPENMSSSTFSIPRYICTDKETQSLWTVNNIHQCQKWSDFLISLASFSIPLELFYFVSYSSIFPFRWIFL
ncbi:hypothetical protein MRB53_025220 [Persea americana]|uniref:Uncharacterized protein n=1 Tax=Persea americana TaxID=3435 RepID=A0ACC2LEJ1_PERAE|nr:hypothetical protein MRB53_025220 [Persea americana]